MFSLEPPKRCRVEMVIMAVAERTASIGGRSPKTVRRQNIWRRSERNLVEHRPRLGLILGGPPSVLQASVFAGLSFDSFALFDDGYGPSEVSSAGVTLFGLS